MEESEALSESAESSVAMEALVAEFIKAIKSNRPPPDQVDLPIFHPERDDATKWLGQVEAIKATFEWSDVELLVRVGRFLLQNAKKWYDDWTPEVRDWISFKREFADAFPPRRNLGRLLCEAASYDSSFCNTYDAYVHKKTAMLRNLRVTWNDSDLVELVVFGIKESHVKDAAMTRDCKTIPELLAYLSTFAKRVPTSEESEPLPKRKKFGLRDHDNKPVIKCHNCGKPGHLRRQCRLSSRKRFQPENINESRPKPSTSSDNKSICSFCAKTGHSVEKCFIKNAIEERRKVQFCTMGKSATPTEIFIDGKQFNGLIDTGSDVSLISEAFRPLFANKIENHSTVLKGIMPGKLAVSEQFEANVEITGVKTRLMFLVVPSHILDFDVLVGCNLYQDPDLVTFTDQNGSKVIRKHVSGIRRVQETPSQRAFVVPDEFYELVSCVLNEFSAMITTGYQVSAIKTASLKIRLMDSHIVNRAPPRLSFTERAAVREIIQELLENDIIRPSESPYASPILLVRKKDGPYRMCVDYRELNAHTVKDRYPLPLIDMQIDRLGKAKYYTSLDMASGFHQIPVHPDSVEKTGFVTPDGHYDYLRMPFGLANAPAVFQRAVFNALGPLKDTIALVYLDDILIPSKTVEEGIESLKKVLVALKTAGFSLNIAKCKFLQTTIEYLGREISIEGVRPDPRKIQALTHSPVPRNVKQVRQFMGLAGYFRKFIPNFASVTACITKLTKTNESFLWTDEQQVARDVIIQHLTSRPLLAIFDPDLPTELHTDASAIGYGGILLQKSDGQTRVIGYFSKRTTPSEANYHSYELETLAIVNSLKHFRTYLLGINFTIITDCNAVKTTATKKTLLPRVARWWSYMQDFNFTLVYRKGSSLPHVDFLSRNPIVRRVAHNDWLRIAQRGNAEVQDILEKLKTGKVDPNQYVEKDGMLLHQEKRSDGTKLLRWFVPRQNRLGLLRIFHDEQCHLAADKTCESIRQHFWFPRMRNFVNNYCKHCLLCAIKKTRTGPLQGYIHPLPKPDEPLHTVHADCLGPLGVTPEGYKHVLVFVDAFTKYCLLIPLKTLTAQETKEQFQHFFSLFGTPKRIVTDAGRNFQNLELTRYLDMWGVNYHFVTPDVHRGNGQVERYMRTIMNLLRIETKIQSEWAKHLWKIQLVLNTTVQKTIGMTPLQALLGITTSTPLVQSLVQHLAEDIRPIRNLKADREKVRKALDASGNSATTINAKRRDSIQFKVGDIVLMHRDSTMHKSKLLYEFMGPYEIISVTTEGRYEIRRLGKNAITKAAKEQLRLWPSDWSVACEMDQLLEFLESEIAEDV